MKKLLIALALVASTSAILASTENAAEIKKDIMERLQNGTSQETVKSVVAKALDENKITAVEATEILDSANIK